MRLTHESAQSIAAAAREWLPIAPTNDVRAALYGLAIAADQLAKAIADHYSPQIGKQP